MSSWFPLEADRSGTLGLTWESVTFHPTPHGGSIHTQTALHRGAVLVVPVQETDQVEPPGQPRPVCSTVAL